MAKRTRSRSRRPHYYRNPPPSMYHPEIVSTTDTVVLGGIMLGIIAVVGFAFFSAKTASAATQVLPGTPAAPPQLPPAPAPSVNTPIPSDDGTIPNDWNPGHPVSEG